jgi:hypothetical protein
MNSQKTGTVFTKQTYTGVMQDKYPPGRITAWQTQPATATLVADFNPRANTNASRSQNAPPSAADIRPKHHGSETRRTVQIAGRVSPAVKSELGRIARLNGWTESKTTANLVEQALAGNLAEQFSVMLKTTIQEAITTQMQKEGNRAANLALEAFQSAEWGRVLIIYLIRLFLGSDIDILPQIIKDLQDQTRDNVSMALHTERPKN